MAVSVHSGAEPNIKPAMGGKKRALSKAVFLAEGAHKTMLVSKRLIAFVVTCVAVLTGGSAALATTGQPVPWQIGLQPAATPVMVSTLSTA